MLRTTFQNREMVVGCPECQTHSTSITQKTLGGIKKIAISIARHVTPIPRCWSCLSKFCSIFTFFTAVGYQPSAIVDFWSLNMLLTEIAHLSAESFRKPKGCNATALSPDNYSLKMCRRFKFFQFPEDMTKLKRASGATADEFAINSPSKFVSREDLCQGVLHITVTQ